MEAWVRDVRYGVRRLLKSPGFTLAVILSLGLGSAATIAIFTLLDAVVFRPLPYANPDRLVTVWETNAAKDLQHERISPVNFMDYRALDVFEDAAAWWVPDLNLTDPGQEPIRVNAVEASSNFFNILGVPPLIGRWFTPQTTLFGRENEVVISHRLWRSRYSGDPAIVGRTIRLDGVATTVLGVMPAGFNFPRETDVWQRLIWDMTRHSRGAHFMESVARLKPGVGVDRVAIELDALTTRLGAESPTTNQGWGARPVMLDREIAGFFRPALFVLLGAVALLLLIGCLNVANLMLARATTRQREVAVLMALGASRQRLIRQFFTESLLLGFMSITVGFLAAWTGLRVFVSRAPIEIPRLAEVAIDGRVVLFALGLAFTTALVFGVMPAFFVSRPDLQQALKEGARGAAGSGARARNALVIVEVALAVLLLVGAGLLLRSLTKLLDEDPGFSPLKTVTASMQLPIASYGEWPRVQRFYLDLLDAIRVRPGVVSVAASNFLPLEPGWRIPFLIQGRPPVKAGDEPIAQHHTVTDDYFSALRVPVLSGRGFTDRDTVSNPGVVVINATLARQYWPAESPLGQKIKSSVRVVGPMGRALLPNLEYEVVGVVADVKNAGLGNRSEPAIYFSERQFPFRNLHVIVQGRIDSAALAGILREEVRHLDGSLPVSNLRPMDDVLDESVEQPRLLTLLMTAFALLSVLLAGLGIYGLLSYSVNQRRQEISIRMAIGASRAHVVWLVASQSLLLTVIGAGIGIAAAYWSGRALSSLLFGITAADPITFTVVPCIVIVIALVACAGPAHRASGVDPLIGLRAE